MVKAIGGQDGSMSNRHRNERGQFTEELTEQGILKLFDRADAPFLTAPEIADDFGVTRQAVTYRLKQMQKKELVGRKVTGASAVAWWARCAPELSPEAAARVEQGREEIESGDVVALEDV